VPPPAPFEGFGSDTPGGTGQPVYRVTTLAPTGTGSLQEALSASNRYIVFDVAGTINTSGDITANGKSFITIDGASAPWPGITIAGGGALSLQNDTHDIIVQHIRVRNGSDDGFRVYDSHDIVFDHVSSADCDDGSLDITEGSYNVTVQWSILRNIEYDASGNMLVAYGSKWVSLHHNLFRGHSRNPLADARDGPLTGAVSLGSLQADVRNNIVWGWGRANGAEWGYGSGADFGGRMNVVNNFYEWHGTYPGGLALNAILIDHNAGATPSLVYTAGNLSGNGLDINDGNASTPFPADAVTTEQTCVAASRVLMEAGCRPLDAIDQAIIGEVSLLGLPSISGLLRRAHAT
jgi:hypothetical protein